MFHPRRPLRYASQDCQCLLIFDVHVSKSMVNLPNEQIHHNEQFLEKVRIVLEPVQNVVPDLVILADEVFPELLVVNQFLLKLVITSFCRPKT